MRAVENGEFERVGSGRTIKVDMRIIAATNRDLVEAVRKGSFRLDLFQRLNVFPLEVPSLRERKEDIPLLARFFVKKYAERFNKLIKSISMEAMNGLLNYNWPGNVRELENLIERAVILETEETITEIENLLEEKRVDSFNLKEGFKEARTRLIEDFEKTYIISLLELYKGNLSAASRHSGIYRKDLWRKMKKYGIKREAYFK